MAAGNLPEDIFDHLQGLVEIDFRDNRIGGLKH